VGPLDNKLTEIVGMRDPDQPGGSMSGGRRRNRRNSRRNRKNSRKNSRKNRKNSRKNSRKNRKNSRRNRRQGGGGSHWNPSPIGAPNMLLSQSEAEKAGTADFGNPLLKN
jgi:hypothetical protein